jgi:hypothetical protein
MRLKTSTRLLAATLVALGLAACTQRGQVPTAALGGDDDVFCRANNVAPGSPEYVACRKDRDFQRGSAAARADQRQRDLADYMLNNPVHP